MNDDDHKRKVEREARKDRPFSLASAIGREGGGFFRGASPVPKLEQVTTELCQFIAANIDDSSGALRVMLERQVRTNETIVGKHFDDPFGALEIIILGLLDNDARYFEFVQQIDAEWGRLMLERPHFQEPGEAADDEDEYTHASVRVQLESLLAKVRGRS